jgi:hypothetical protein
MVDQLLAAQRPRAAFHVVRMDWEKIETSRLKRLLLAVATTNGESAGDFKLNAYDISAALQSLDGRTGVSPDEMAQLEFLFIAALDGSKHGIPNLERQVAESPALFVHAVALAHKRSDDGVDPPEWRIEDPERRTAAVLAVRHLLEHIRRIPGSDPGGNIVPEGLSAWLAAVRQLSAQAGRADSGDYFIGQLLSRAPSGDDGVWPCLPVRDAMESIASPSIAEGFEMGVFNARGVYSRGEGGAQERELAAKYRGWAQRLAPNYPYVASVLESIAASYDREAQWHDSEAKVQKRVRH